ncbi:hypothetical protein ACSFC0_02335 [Serratia marcescens]|uniref:hypothetical protein n=1 Tax=Serratia marcescens TaxID=615 RepID=UPI003ED883B2
MVSRRKLLSIALPAAFALPISASGRSEDNVARPGGATSYDSVASLKSGTAENGAIACLLSYHEGGRIGGGLLVHSVGNDIKINMITTYPSANGVWSRVMDRTGAIDASFAGMVPDGKYDNTADHINLINYADQEGIDISYGSGVYYHSGIVEKKASFSCPNLIGCGGRRADKGTILKFSSNSFMKIKGGSGILCSSNISGIHFSGDGDNNGILIVADQCGLSIERCIFSNCHIGIRMINESSKGFSEFNVLDKCTFSASCSTGISYERDKGNESFHGTGLSECIFQQQTKDDNSPHVLIGKNCLVYNAPMSIHVFRGLSSSPIIQHDGLPRSNFYGIITVEKHPKNTIDLVSGGVLYIVGSVVCLSENLATTKTVFCSRFQANSDGSVNYIRNPASLSGTFEQTDSVDVIKFNFGESAFIDVSIMSPAGIERKLVFAAVDRDGNGMISDTALSPMKSKLAHDSIISFNKSMLSITRPSSDGRQWIVDISFVASRLQYSMK